MMSTQKELDVCYMQCAIEHAKLSKAKRKQVGAVLVTETGVLIGACNGLPKEFGNECEEKAYNSDKSDYVLITKQEVLHSESNAILKCAKEGVDCRGSTLYVTLAPCVQCSSMMLQAGVKRIVYLEDYRNMKGVDNLKEICFNIEKF